MSGGCVLYKHHDADLSFRPLRGSELGNESTFLTALSYLRTRYPDGELLCVSGWPEVAANRYGLKGVPITTRASRIWNRNVPIIRRVPIAFGEAVAELRQYLRVFRILKGADMLIVPGTGLVNDAYGLSDWGPYSLFKWILMAKLRRARVLVVSVGAGPLTAPQGESSRRQPSHSLTTGRTGTTQARTT